MPFPVRTPYRPRPDLFRLGALAHGRLERRPLDADCRLPAELAGKWTRLRAVPQRCVALAPDLVDDPSGVWARVCRSAAVLVEAEDAWRRGEGLDPAAPVTALPLRRVGDELHALAAGWAMPADSRQPFGLRALRADALPVIDWIASRPAAERPLHALALAMQEDLVWMEAPMPGASVRAAMLHVCWPSGWDPASKAGLDFASIHGPVADGEALRAASAALSRAIVTQGPFVRFVWTVAPVADLARHPDDAPVDPPPAPGSLADLWFRCERQVTLPVPGVPEAALFLIRVHVAPLAEVVAAPERRARLVAAVDSMSPATLAYKRLEGIGALLR